MDISKFCGLNYPAPFSSGAFSYAISSGLLLRVERMADAPEAEPHTIPAINSIRDFPFSSSGMRQITLKLPIRWDYEACDHEHEDAFGHSFALVQQDCPACKGTGWVLSSRGVIQEGGMRLNQIIIDKIKDLPGLRVFVRGGILEMGYFDFDGGCGHFMPMTAAAETIPAA